MGVFSHTLLLIAVCSIAASDGDAWWMSNYLGESEADPQSTTDPWAAEAAMEAAPKEQSLKVPELPSTMAIQFPTGREQAPSADQDRRTLRDDNLLDPRGLEVGADQDDVIDKTVPERAAAMPTKAKDHPQKDRTQNEDPKDVEVSPLTSDSEEMDTTTPFFGEEDTADSRSADKNEDQDLVEVSPVIESDVISATAAVAEMRDTVFGDAEKTQRKLESARAKAEASRTMCSGHLCSTDDLKVAAMALAEEAVTRPSRQKKREDSIVAQAERAARNANNVNLRSGGKDGMARKNLHQSIQRIRKSMMHPMGQKTAKERKRKAGIRAQLKAAAVQRQKEVSIVKSAEAAANHPPSRAQVRAHKAKANAAMKKRQKEFLAARQHQRERAIVSTAEGAADHDDAEPYLRRVRAGGWLPNRRNNDVPGHSVRSKTETEFADDVDWSV